MKKETLTSVFETRLSKTVLALSPKTFENTQANRSDVVPEQKNWRLFINQWRAAVNRVITYNSAALDDNVLRLLSTINFKVYVQSDSMSATRWRLLVKPDFTWWKIWPLQLLTDSLLHAAIIKTSKRNFLRLQESYKQYRRRSRWAEDSWK